MLTRKLKKLLLLTAALLLSFSAGGCNDPSSPVPEQVPVEEKIPSPPSFVEQLVGRYRYNSEENGDILLELYHINGMLIAEADEEYAAYFAAELFPVDSAIAEKPAAMSAAFTVYPFSGFSNSGMYWEEKPRIIISKTESGIRIIEEDNTNIDFIRDNATEPLHTVGKYAELLPPSEETVFPPEICGVWTADYFSKCKILLCLQQDGTLLWYCKEDGEPVFVYFGAASADAETGTLTIIAERVGYAAMPFFFTLEYELTDTDLLLLKNVDTDALLPAEDHVTLTQKTENE